MSLASPRYPFTENYVSGAPEDAGVYALFDERDIIIFLGLAEGAHGIRACLLDHLSGRAQPSMVKYYGWEVIHQPILRYEEVLRHLKGTGRWPRFNNDAR